MTPSLVVVRLFGPQLDCISCACLIGRHPSSSDFGGWHHRYFFLEVGHLSICFWSICAQISDGRFLWVGEGGRSFSHDGWLTTVTVCCSKLFLQFLHCSGKFIGCSWFKVKSIAFQVSVPSLEVSLVFGIRAWFILRLANLALYEFSRYRIAHSIYSPAFSASFFLSYCR